MEKTNILIHRRRLKEILLETSNFDKIKGRSKTRF